MCRFWTQVYYFRNSEAIRTGKPSDTPANAFIRRAIGTAPACAQLKKGIRPESEQGSIGPLAVSAAILAWPGAIAIGLSLGSPLDACLKCGRLEHGFPPDIISYAVRLYHCFTLSHRDIEHLLSERSIDVTYKTIRRGRNL